MAYNQFSGYGSYPFPNYSSNFNQQYGGPTPYSAPQLQPQPQPQQPQQHQTANGQYFYVNGIEGAKAFLLAPNSSAILFDSDSSKFFIKTANQQGQAILKQFEYSEILPKTDAMPQKQTADKYITRDEFEAAKAEIQSLLTKQTKITKEVAK